MQGEMFERGLEIRRSVLGAEHVDKQLASADDFTRPLQELVTEYCWGALWGREGLTRKQRSSRKQTRGKPPLEVDVDTATFPDEGYYHVPQLEPEECRRLLRLKEET